jgi:SAM-dependent methyltransferase
MNPLTKNIYTSGEYKELTKSWHTEDSYWKAEQIVRVLIDNCISPRTVADVGCGAGVIIDTLAEHPKMKNTYFTGYDIAPHAIDLCKKMDRKTNVEYLCKDVLSETSFRLFDLLLVIDVIEHVPDYLGFLYKCKSMAEFKIYHIPLDIHVSAVFRNSLLNARYSVGHLHYFSAESAIASLRDTGHEIIDYRYTHGATDLFKQHRSIKTGIANTIRSILSKFSVAFAARMVGGYSLLVLSK